MSLALRIYEDGLCSQCQQPGVLAYDPYNQGEFELMDDVVCLGCEAREMEEDQPNPGVKKYVINHIDEPR